MLRFQYCKLGDLTRINPQQPELEVDPDLLVLPLAVTPTLRESEKL
jgi:hypothetical protein